MARAADPRRKEDILHAARKVFEERGYTNARMAEIAERAGVATGTLYLYFKSKEALVTALCEDYLTRLGEKLIPLFSEPEAAKAIADSVHAIFAFAEIEQDLMRLLDLRTALGKRCDALAADQHLQQMLSRQLQERMRKGEIRSYNPQVLAQILSGLMEWVTKACLIWGIGDITSYKEVLIRMLQHALLSDRAEAPCR